jgi:hypothetical protein
MRRHPIPVIAALVCIIPCGMVQGQRVDRNLHLPSGWDDVYFERIEQGLSPKTVVAVLDFGGGEVLEPHLRFSMSSMLITSLVQVGRFVVVERTRIEDLIREQQLRLSGFVDPATAVQVGKILGAELVVHGLVTKATEQTIDKFAYDLVRIEVGVDIRAVNTGTGEIVISETAEAAAEAQVITTADGTIVSGPTDYDPLYVNATIEALDSVAVLVSNEAPVVGLVVAVMDREVIIDIGADHGLMPGDTFVLFRRGEEILHPVSGERLGWRKTVLGRIRLVSTEETLSTGEVTRVTDEDIEILAGDLAIYEAPGGQR